MTPGDIILKCRLEQKMSQEELSEASGISIRTIQRIEKGQVQPRPYTLRTILKALDISVEELEGSSKPATDEKIKLNIFFLSHITVFILPFVYTVFLIIFWKRNNWSEKNDWIGKKILSFHVLWATVSIPLVLVSPFLVGEVAVGKYPVLLLTYLILAVINLSFITFVVLRVKSSRPGFLSYIPVVFR